MMLAVNPSGCSHSPSRLALPKTQAVPQVEKSLFEAFPTDLCCRGDARIYSLPCGHVTFLPRGSRFVVSSAPECRDTHPASMPTMSGQKAAALCLEHVATSGPVLPLHQPFPWCSNLWHSIPHHSGAFP